LDKEITMGAAFYSPGTLTRKDLPTVPVSAIRPYIPAGLEVDAGGHWLFGPGSASLVDEMHAVALVLGAGAIGGVAYTPNTAIITSPGGTVAAGTQGGKALVTPFADALQQTLCVVARRPSTAGHIFAGALQGAAGSCISFYSGKVTFVVGGQPNLMFDWPDGVAVGDLCFLALSEDGANKTYTTMIGPAAPVSTVHPAAKTVNTVNKVAFGNGYYTTATFTNSAPELEEAIVFPRYLSPAELLGVRRRSMVRGLGRGASVK
jgi:hypothetical protein